jgi:Protease inhibitor Inh
MLTRPVALLLASAALAGCTSSRFGDFSSAGSPRIDSGYGQAMPSPQRRPDVDQDVIAGGQPAPDGAVVAQDIPPPPGAVRSSSDVGPSAIEPALRPADQSQPRIMVEEPPRGGPAGPSAVAALPRQEQPRATQAPSATTLAGTWTVTDAGDRCRITLTSTPLFEFYRANPQSCRAPSLARINAWEQRGSEVVLLQPGGRVAARLFPQGSGYSGATASGATVTMTR